MTYNDILTDAMLEINAIGQGDTPSGDDVSWTLRKMNRMFDTWAAQGIMAFNVTFSEFTLIANHSPHTIGPTGDFVVSQRPVMITSAQFKLQDGSIGTNPSIFTPIAIRDDDWWAINPIPELTSSIVTNLYYSPDWPNGKCYFWPVCNGTNKVRLELWGLISPAFDTKGQPNGLTSTTFNLPVGYWDAVVTNLAVNIASGFEKPISPSLAENARTALKAVINNNVSSPRIQTADFGMPRRAARPDFNFLTGWPWNTQ